MRARVQRRAGANVRGCEAGERERAERTELAWGQQVEDGTARVKGRDPHLDPPPITMANPNPHAARWAHTRSPNGKTLAMTVLMVFMSVTTQ